MIDLPDKLRDLIIPEPNSGCWIWIGVCSGQDSRGGIYWGGTWTAASRTVYESLRGRILAPILHHTCEFPPCVNPDHLEPVTGKQHYARHRLLRERAVGTPDATLRECGLL